MFRQTSSNTEYKEFSRNFFTIDATVTKLLDTGDDGPLESSKEA